MAFEIVRTDIDDLVIVRPFLAQDARGYYKKVFEREIFEALGIPVQVFECSDIFSNRGAIRGLHYQEKHSQGKLLHVLKGKIYDVALDLRRESRTFGRWYATTLSEQDHRTIYIPPGFAHGFMSLEDGTLFSYLCTNYYEPDSCGGILFNDPGLGIPWPIRDEEQLIITPKDRNWPTFEVYRRMKGL